MKVYSVEISNICNLTCSYCPHPSQKRLKGMMSFSTFTDVIELVILCQQSVVHLHNFGEPLLHPELSDFISYAKSKGIDCSFYTNGLLFSKDVALELYQAGLREIYLSEHIAGQSNRIQTMLRESSISLSIKETFNPREYPKHNWAGQVDLTNSDSNVARKTMAPCIFERKNAVVVLWDGRVNTCCIDVNGTGITGTVKDYLNKNNDICSFKPIPLCESCNLMRGEESLD